MKLLVALADTGLKFQARLPNQHSGIEHDTDERRLGGNAWGRPPHSSSMQHGHSRADLYNACARGIASLLWSWLQIIHDVDAAYAQEVLGWQLRQDSGGVAGLVGAEGVALAVDAHGLAVDLVADQKDVRGAQFGRHNHFDSFNLDSDVGENMTVHLVAQLLW